MKRNIILVLLSFLFINLVAQNSIVGIVIDKETRQPVSDVIVQYGASSKDYIYTTATGRFSIPQKSEDIIHFQCIGYKSRSFPKSALEQNNVVALELNPIALNPIVISAVDADKLLDEAMLNTKKKLLLDQPIVYLLHFLQTKKTDSLTNEIYLKYATTLTEKDLKKNIKKARIPYTFNLIDVSRLRKTTTPTSELYGAEYHASHLFTFGKSEDNKTTRSYSTDSSLIILQIEPLAGKGGWAKGEITIHKNDMTIAEMEIESVDSLLNILPYNKYMGKQIKVVRKVGRFKFQKQNNKYYMTECFTYYRFRAIDENQKEEEISYYCDVESKGFSKKEKLRKRRLSGFCQELFYFPTSTAYEFWNEVYETDSTLDNEQSQTNNSFDSAHGRKSTSQKIRGYLAQLIIPVSILGVLYFIK